MCFKVDSSFVMIHLLKEKESCTIKELVLKKRVIEKSIPSVFVDVSKNSILNSVMSFPEIFSWDNNLITRKKKADEFFELPLIDFFDNNIDKSIKTKITRIFEVGY